LGLSGAQINSVERNIVRKSDSRGNPLTRNLCDRRM
jgi:hypothetical protein